MSHDRKVQGIENWDNEGGSQLASLAAAFEIDEFESTEQRILAFLGASLLCLWDDLPADAHQVILNQEAVRQAYDESLVRSRIREMLK